MSMTRHILPATPLRASIERVRAANAYLPPIAVGVPAGPGWTTADVIFGPDPTILRELLTAAQAMYRTTRADFAAMSVFNHYSWLVVSAALGAFLLDQLLPDLSPGNIALHRDDTGSGDQLAFVSDAVRTLAGSSAARHPAATVVPATLLDREAVRTAIEAHFAPVIAAIRAAAPLGQKALWLALADNCAWVLMHYGSFTGDRHGLPGLVAGFLHPPGSRLRGGTSVLEIAAGGEVHRFIDRGSCCLSYKLPDGSKCAACPLRRREDRIARLKAHLAALPAART